MDKQDFGGPSDLGDFLEKTKCDQVVGGLNIMADKGLESYTGRTFVALYQSADAKINDIVMIYNSALATQISAMDVLANDFDCEKGKTIMFDGGGSTQLTIKGMPMVSSSRSLPQVLCLVSN